MTAAGWHADPTADLGMGDGCVGLFRHRLNENFATTAFFAWFGELPPLQVDTVIGVSCQRTFRVWPYLLKGYPHSELRVGVDDLDPASGVVTLWELDEVDRAAGCLVTPVLERAIGWAEPLALFEALIAALRARDYPEAELYDIPVLLASAGRSEAARAALAAVLATPADRGDEHLRKDFAARFGTWLEAGAPPTPPNDPGSEATGG
jgi:hypothetical protein